MASETTLLLIAVIVCVIVIVIQYAIYFMRMMGQKGEESAGLKVHKPQPGQKIAPNQNEPKPPEAHGLHRAAGAQQQFGQTYPQQGYPPQAGQYGAGGQQAYAPQQQFPPQAAPQYGYPPQGPPPRFIPPQQYGQYPSAPQSVFNSDPYAQDPLRNDPLRDDPFILDHAAYEGGYGPQPGQPYPDGQQAQPQLDWPPRQSAAPQDAGQKCGNCGMNVGIETETCPFCHSNLKAKRHTF